MLTLYQVEWCPYCHRVRQTMTELGLTYLTVTVPADRDERAELVSIADQSSVPVLVDGDKVYRDSDEIITYLRATYPAPVDAGDHAAHGAWRTAASVSLAPCAALARLKGLLDDKGFKVISQVKGAKISERLPKEYTLLHVAVPVAAMKSIEADSLAPTAVSLPIAVAPTKDGNSVVAMADPVGQVWLYGVPALIKVQMAVKQRLGEVLKGL